MKFRRLYWVTEQVDQNGHSEVTGVYTSIPDLIHHGLRWVEDIPKKQSMRITLAALDSSKKTFGHWTSPRFEGMSDKLQEFVDSGEFRTDDVVELGRAVEAFSASTVRT